MSSRSTATGRRPARLATPRARIAPTPLQVGRAPLPGRPGPDRTPWPRAWQAAGPPATEPIVVRVAICLSGTQYRLGRLTAYATIGMSVNEVPTIVLLAIDG